MSGIDALSSSPFSKLLRQHLPHAPRPALHRLRRPLAQVPLNHRLRLIPQRWLRHLPSVPSPSTAEHRTTLLSSSASSDITRAARIRRSLVFATRGTTNFPDAIAFATPPPAAAPAARLTRPRTRSRGPASRSVIRRAVSAARFPNLNIVSKKQLPQQSPHRRSIVTDLLRERPGLLQPKALDSQPLTQPVHAAKYNPVTEATIKR